MSSVDSIKFSNSIRKLALQMITKAKASHIGSNFSMADILAVLYCNILKVDPNDSCWLARDRFILSKGHAAAIYYATLAEKGFFDKSLLETYSQDGSKLLGHITKNGVPGIELSTGSLGHGLPVACGMSIAAKREKRENRVFVLLSDGEMDEGSNWEAILFAGHHQLDNLAVIIDYNKIQSYGNVSEILNLEPLSNKFQAFNWNVQEVDGHNHGQLNSILKTLPFKGNKPNCIIAHTIKGKGVSFMENNLAWHYKNPSFDQYQQALNELEKIV